MKKTNLKDADPQTGHDPVHRLASATGEAEQAASEKQSADAGGVESNLYRKKLSLVEEER
jgi:hypothetical protein